ncbi:MAG: SDR family NAD(P)-dependent oxidoreductase [Planctomycetota bacterium]
MEQKTILITGATDGIGFETARMLASLGHHVLLHGRSPEKLRSVHEALKCIFETGSFETYIADLSELAEVDELAERVKDSHSGIDVLVNNAGVFVTLQPITDDGLDVRFVVNTIAPYRLSKKLLSSISLDGRIINLSSAAQSRVNMNALIGQVHLPDGEAYAQSKLAITMWTTELAKELGSSGPTVIAVNPGSFLGSKMVKEAYGRNGKDLSIGARILVAAALSDDFASASGRYFDNDTGQFASPHPDALDDAKCQKLVEVIESILQKTLPA